jgi:hypothetical protein
MSRLLFFPGYQENRLEPRLRYNGGMTHFPSISLNTDWRSYPPDDTDPLYSASQLDDSSWDHLSILADWPRHLLGQAETIHLQRKFDLEPIGDVCIRIFLHLEAAPEATSVYVNGWHVGTSQSEQPLIADVTDYVTLQDNVLLLKVSKAGRLGAVSLQRIPCDEVD